MLLANPVASPLTMAPGLMGSPLGGLGGPLGMTMPVGGMGVMHPAMQVAPNWMSFQHQAPQLLTNPYMGGPFSQLPFSQPSRSLPFAPSAGYGMALYPQASPTLGGWPFAAQMPMMPMNPYLMPPAPPKAASLPFNPLDLLRPVTSQPTQAPQPAPSSLPFISPWATQPAQAPVPAAAPAFNPLELFKSATPQPAQAAQPAPTGLPFVSPWAAPPQAPAPMPVAKSAPPAAPAFNPADLFKPAAVPAAPVAPAIAPVAPQVKAPDAAPAVALPFNPFDPAYWLMPLKAAPISPAK
jgi:hypothetical protein